MEFPNDYQGVHTALTNGREVDPASELGRQFTKLSYTMVEKTLPRVGTAKKRKFLEFFALSPGQALEQQK
jgi:hypothetical protein